MSDPTEPGSTSDYKPTVEDKLARELLVEELRHRRDKEWKIFAYATGVLLAIIAAVVTISARPGFVSFGTRQKVILVFTLLVLTAAAALWLFRNLWTEATVLRRLITGNYDLQTLPSYHWSSLLTGYIAALFLIFVITLWAIIWLGGSQAPPPSPRDNTTSTTSWYFAVSGDSRDCGDLIMPKIAQAIANNRQNAPVDFYLHLGDLRALYRVDCDIAKVKDPAFQCVTGDPSPNQTQAMKDEYLPAAWPDYINSQIRPFEKLGIPFYVGIGNHELINRTRDQFREQFKEWLTKPAIQDQRASDRTQGIDSKDGDTYFHFVWKGVDIIYLDNANIYEKEDPGFPPDELTWLDQVLKRDEADPQVKTIIVGMHAALPESVSRSHAMDKNCNSFCNGRRAYERLRITQSKGKKVYVMASHSHYFEEYVYDTPEHGGHGLPGWIIGTAGAEQYRQDIRYGYLLVEVTPDGLIHNSFKEVYRDSLPAGPEALTRYCFEQNKPAPSPAPTAGGDQNAKTAAAKPKTEAYKTAADCPPCSTN